MTLGARAYFSSKAAFFSLNFAKDINWYIQSSFAVNYYGIKDRPVTDLDIRINYPLRRLYKSVKAVYNNQAYIRPFVKYSEGEFRDECIVIPFWKTHIDITSDIITYNKKEDIEFNLPFDRQYRWVPFNGLQIPICSVRYLVAYKLINKRNEVEKKNDVVEASKLLKHF